MNSEQTSSGDHSYFAFLDIHGYRQLLDADVKNGTVDFKDKMIRAFRAFDAINRSRYSHKAISDSIFISCADRNAAEEILHLLRRVFLGFLSEGLLIRGGVSFGAHFENQTITYSPVLTQAYVLESEKAEHPRILVDDNILEMFPHLRRSGIVLKSGRNWFINVAHNESFDDVWASAKATCDANRAAIDANDRVRMKHRWLQDCLLELAHSRGIAAPSPYLRIFDDRLSPSCVPEVQQVAHPNAGG